MLKLAIFAASIFVGVGAIIVVKSPKLSIRRVIAAFSMISLGLGIVFTGMGKYPIGFSLLLISIAGLFSLRFVGQDAVRK